MVSYVTCWKFHFLVLLLLSDALHVGSFRSLSTNLRKSSKPRSNSNFHVPKVPSLTISLDSWGRTALGMAASSFPQRRRRRPVFTQVVSDVDDTLKSSGGVNVGGVALGGIDVQYGRGEFYPGVGEFILAVSRHGLTGEDAASPPKIAILTARAEEFKAALEIKEGSKLAMALRRAGEREGVQGWGVGPVLYGSVAEWIIQERKGLRKFANFERLLQQDPTGTIFQYVYVGDVGELDQEAGETMLREYPEVVKAVFLHVVSDREGASPPIPPPKFINGRPVVFFRTYVGAAVDAVQLGFMNLDGLRSVMTAAVEKLSAVPESSDKWRDLRRDIARAEVLLTGR
jgi:hypothetical protein